AGWLSTAALGVSLLAAMILAATSWNSGPLSTTLPWFQAGDQIVRLDFALNHRSLVMLVVVSFISLMVHIYSTAYMHGDAGYRKYFAMLGFFTFSMQGIVVS